jgi:hypothetical protein
MATPKSIPSKINTTTAQVVADARNRLYITAILAAANLEIDGNTANGLGPIQLSSPIVCDSFNPSQAAQIAYYEK